MARAGPVPLVRRTGRPAGRADRRALPGDRGGRPRTGTEGVPRPDARRDRPDRRTGLQLGGARRPAGGRQRARADLPHDPGRRER